MQLFYVVSCLAALALAEPPVSYLGPQTASLPLNTLSAQTPVYQPIPNEQNFVDFQAPTSTYGAPSTQEDTYNAAHRYSSTQHQSGYANAPMETQVHKHIYVHVPPKDFEDEEMTPRVTHQMAPKQKHYKIVFIKAPSAPAVRAPVVPPTPQNEEKTLIYVLHKKPEAQPDIVIPTPVPTTPSKPEVYFIKYKTKKDEAPVYGPPPASYEIQARNDIEPAKDYANSLISSDVSDVAGVQPAAIDASQVPQFMNEEQTAELYRAPTTSGAISNEDLTTTAVEPNNQYLPPVTTLAPIIVAEEQTRAPAVRYGAPVRRYIKRRK